VGRHLRRAVAGVLGAVLLAAAASTPAAASGGAPELRVLSAPAGLVSGGDALVEVRAPWRAHARDVRVWLNGREITWTFRPRSGGRLVGLVDRLRVGRNQLVARLVRHRGRGDRRWRRGRAARLTITNHPISGPIFSGPQQEPFICQTRDFRLPASNETLGPPLDKDCSIETRVDYVYRSIDGTFKPLPDPDARPADLAQTTTSRGRTVDYIVRMETGTINRAIYQIAMLHDPAVDRAPRPWRRGSAGWNRRLVYSFGGGCAPGYRQGATTGGALNDLWLSKGFAAAASSLNVFGNNCNDVLSAETMMMVKERFVEGYGVPRHTIGWGGSGGSMQQHLIAQNYPGLLDGITPSASFPDALTFFTPISDCQLLDRTFESSSVSWTFEQKTAVAGWPTWDFCTTSISSDWGALVRAGRTPDDVQYVGCNPSYLGPPVIPPSLIYDPVTNPDGARCTWFDNAVNIFGRDPATGFALRALDNVGVQYGLTAFNRGQISAEQFLELNERIGGYDIDGNIVDERTVADPRALGIAYRTGRVNSGAGGLASIPIIDFRQYRDDIPDPHDAVRSEIMRARLIATNGTAANQVILTAPGGSATGPEVYASVQADVLRLMDQWLTNIERDRSRYRTSTEKVIRNKPRELVDGCYTDDGDKVTDPGRCRTLYPVYTNPRLAAGDRLTNDVLKCRLQPVERSAYAQWLTAEQFARLQRIFPQGVCDYSRPGFGQRELEDTWLAYPSPGRSVSLQHDDES
jgi:hypothetical protein